MKVVGISMVRNEADVIRLSILLHLSLGLDAVLVVNNGSTDRTGQILRRMGREDRRVKWSADHGPFDQAATLTRLARKAFRQGADWVVPFDADEFWWAKEGDLRAVLAASTAEALRAEVVLFVQDRRRLVSSEEALLTMTRRAPDAVAVHRSEIEGGRFAYVETRRKHKWVFRPTPRVKVEYGNHAVSGVAGITGEGIGLACLHAPLRSRSALEHKADHGERALEFGGPPRESWHLKRWAKLRAVGDLDPEWAANSYDGETLDVYGVEKPMVEDLRLRDVVAPLLSHAQSRSRSKRAAKEPAKDQAPKERRVR